MFDWLFKAAQSTTNNCSREVKVTSSRHGEKTITVYGDLPVDAINAIRIVADSLPAAEPGETREIKAYLG
jgi:negative regulator of sigma E activity